MTISNLFLRVSKVANSSKDVALGARSVRIVVFALLATALSPPVAAEIPQACLGYWNNVAVNPMPPGVFGCQSPGPFLIDCYLMNLLCAPPCASCARASHPIELATGDTYITETDIRVPGLGGGLMLTRTWNSIVFYGGSVIGLFGPNWTSNFEETISVGSDNFIKYKRADGSVWSFGYTGSMGSSYLYATAGPSNQTTVLNFGPTNQSYQNWTLVFQNGETRVFDGVSGRLLSITDRNGNMITLSYDDSFRLTTVTDAASRHLYFVYAAPNSYLVTAVNSDFGVGVSYSYDAQGRLAQVTAPDNSTTSFQYDELSRITTVLDSNAKVIETHTYNSCGQGLTAARAGGVDAITVSYPSPCHFTAP